MFPKKNFPFLLIALSISTAFLVAEERVEKESTQFASAYSSHPDSHFLKNIENDNGSLELEDGSQWEVSSFDVRQLRKWSQGEKIAITPNYSWFSSYDYYITNKSDGSYVRANLSKEPLKFGPQSHWIVDLDRYGGRIYLENNTIWHVDPKNYPLLKDWITSDHLILGTCDAWASPYDYILINTHGRDYVRVSQY